MDRLTEILEKKKQFLKDGETLIYVKNGEMVALFNNGEELSQVSGKVNEKLDGFLKWLIDENQY